MRRVVLLALVSGCFYTEPINQRPSIDIHNGSSTVPHRGGTVTLSAITSDPENQPVDLAWTVFACTDASAGDCDPDAFDSGTQRDFAFHVRPDLKSQPGQPTQSVLVILAAQDELGAHARPNQELVIPIGNLAPNLALAPDSHYGYVEGVAVSVFATISDDDDPPDNITVGWDVFKPSTAATYQSSVTRMSSNGVSRGEQFVLEAPMGVGTWTVRATATDPLGAQTVKDQLIEIAADHDPCLAQWSPIAPLDGTTARPLSEPTLFSVPVVVDDLDVYPTVVGDPVLGTTRFAWSIEAPGATTFAPLATTGNAVELRPDAYAHGDIVELRVQIYDRRDTPIGCAADALTCSTTSSPSCIQRLTWRLEIL